MLKYQGSIIHVEQWNNTIHYIFADKIFLIGSITVPNVECTYKKLREKSHNIKKIENSSNHTINTSRCVI